MSRAEAASNLDGVCMFLCCRRGPTPAGSRGAPPPREDRASGAVAADQYWMVIGIRTPDPGRRIPGSHPHAKTAPPARLLLINIGWLSASQPGSRPPDYRRLSRDT